MVTNLNSKVHLFLFITVAVFISALVSGNYYTVGLSVVMLTVLFSDAVKKISNSALVKLKSVPFLERFFYLSWVPKAKLYSFRAVEEIRKFESGRLVLPKTVDRYCFTEVAEEPYFKTPTEAYLRFSKLPYVTPADSLKALATYAIQNIDFENEEVKNILKISLADEALSLKDLLKVLDAAKTYQKQGFFFEMFEEYKPLVTNKDVLDYFELKEKIPNISLEPETICRALKQTEDALEIFITLVKDQRSTHFSRIKGDNLLDTAISL